jgi:hypothetical protein
MKTQTNKGDKEMKVPTYRIDNITDKSFTYAHKLSDAIVYARQASHDGNTYELWHEMEGCDYLLGVAKDESYNRT